MEAAYQLPSLSQLSTALKNESPKTAVELQAIVLDALDELQKKINGNATDTVNLFYGDNGKPKTENECRSLLLDLLDPLPFGIQTSPEEAMPRNSRADIAFRLGTIKVPLEAKLIAAWNQVFADQGVPWAAYGQGSCIYFFTNPDDMEINPLNFDATAQPVSTMEKAGNHAAAKLFRLAMLVHGVDLNSKPGAIVSTAHSDDDITKTAEARSPCETRPASKYKNSVNLYCLIEFRSCVESRLVESLHGYI